MLTSKQRSYLSGLAATVNSTVMVGKDGASEGVAQALSAEFKHRELIKVRFVASKDEKAEFAEVLARHSGAELVRIIGNVAVLYRRADKAEDRVIILP